MTTPTSAAWGSSEEPLTVVRKAGLHGLRWTAWLAGATGLAQLVSIGLNLTDTVHGIVPTTYPPVGNRRGAGRGAPVSDGYDGVEGGGAGEVSRSPTVKVATNGTPPAKPLTHA